MDGTAREPTRHERRQAWRRHNDRWVLLFTDVDTRIRFCLCREVLVRGQREVRVQAMTGRAQADRVLQDSRFREFWLQYGPIEVVRYEALKEFPDHHRRQHWRFNTMVMFFGTEPEIDWVARLTFRNGTCWDPKRGLFVPQPALQKVGMPA